ALALSDRVHQVHDAPGEIILSSLQPDLFLRIERCKVLKERSFASHVRMLKVDRLDFDQREVPLSILGRTDLTGNRITGSKVKLAYLRRRNIDIVRPGQVVIFGSAEKAKPVW